MNKISQALLIAVVLILPFLAIAGQNAALPSSIQLALNNASASGSPSALSAVTDRMNNMFPNYRSQISSYVQNIAAPAAQVMASINAMLADVPAKGHDNVFGTKQSADDATTTAEASALNDIDVGAGDDKVTKTR